jgi:predicted transcriptional regulator
MNLQEAIKELINSGMTQGQIGEKVGLTQVAISQIVLGKNKSTNYEAGTELVRLGKLAKRRKGKKNEKV